MDLTSAEDLPAAIGASTSREPAGRYTPPYETVRALTLFAAHAAAVPAIETVYPDFRDAHGLAAYAARGRRDGFTGMMAIHPAQVAPINAAFTPTEAEVAHARAVVAAFAASPDAGALSLDGEIAVFAVIDLLAKVGFGILLVTGAAKLSAPASERAAA